MSLKVCIAPTHLLWNTALGGHAWVFLNWALGLQANGCKLVLLEKARYTDDPPKLLLHLQSFREQMLALGLDAAITLIPAKGELPAPERLLPELSQLLVPLEQVIVESDLLLNFRYQIPHDIVERFERSALVDIDPGLLQLWISGGQVRPAPHDIYFSIGETVGQPAARFPDCGLQWNHTPPPVHLPSWPVVSAPPHAAYTTVTNWWGEYELANGTLINNEKRTAFLEYLELPGLTQEKLELAIYKEPGDESDMALLADHGWNALPAREVSATPEEYRQYIQRSRGEFSCAKRSCMHLANAWISDRTLCYLASGKPAVVQHTGPSRILPDAEGLFRFENIQGAAGHFASISSDYERHCQAARALVEQHFDAEVVLGAVLDKAMSVKARKGVSSNDG